MPYLVIGTTDHPPVDNFELTLAVLATIAPMKTLCPNCELWLVEIEMDAGTGSFFCLRCEDLRDRFERGEDVILGRAILDAPLCCRLCDQDPAELHAIRGVLG